MSSVNSYLKGACRNLQTALNEQCALNPRTKTGFTQQIMEAYRLYNPFRVTFSPAGQQRMLNVTYKPRAVNNGVYNEIANICDGAEVGDYNSVTIEADQKTSVEEKIPIEDLRILCEEPDQFRSMVIADMFNAMMEKINYINLTQIDTITPYIRSVGGVPQPGTYNVDLVVGSSGSRTINSEALVKVLEDLNDMGCGVEPFWIGNASELVEASYLLRLGCCNTNAGIDLTKIQGEYGYIKDHQMNEVLGTNNTIAMIPGSIVMLPWYKHTGGYAGVSGNSAFEIVRDPVTGMQYDLRIREIDCPDRTVVVQLSLHWHLWTIPEDYYKTGDPLHLTKAFVRPVLT